MVSTTLLCVNRNITIGTSMVSTVPAAAAPVRATPPASTCDSA